GIAVNVDSAGLRHRLGPELESTLFHIANEALTNCAKHSHASTVAIVLKREAGKVVLSIADNGIGFTPEAPPGSGLGLITMRERAEFAGGTFRLDAAPGHGTRIEVRV
ncbi:MAG TPA: ATP-binding protein, partial [Azonexus sp.]